MKNQQKMAPAPGTIEHAINKIPGTTSAQKEIYLESLSTYTIAQLFEIRNRQTKLLANKLRLSKLPDRGDRIKLFYERVLNEIENRNEIELAAIKFSDLNIAAKGIKALTALEWSGGKSMQPPDDVVDSDDDENVDPLKIIAQSRAVKTVKVAKPEPSSITPADLVEIASFSKEAIEMPVTSDKAAQYIAETVLEPHGIYVCQQDTKNDKIKLKYKPFNTTITDVHNVDKQRARKTGPRWEVTAATPPVLRNNEATVLTLQESIDIQRKQFDVQKTIQEKQAQERLQARQKIVSENLELLPPNSSTKDPSSFFNNYRVKEEESDSDNDQFCDIEEYGDEDDDRGGVGIPIYD